MEDSIIFWVAALSLWKKLPTVFPLFLGGCLFLGLGSQRIIKIPFVSIDKLHCFPEAPSLWSPCVAIVGGPVVEESFWPTPTWGHILWKNNPFLSGYFEKLQARSKVNMLISNCFSNSGWGRRWVIWPFSPVDRYVIFLLGKVSLKFDGVAVTSWCKDELAIAESISLNRILPLPAKAFPFIKNINPPEYLRRNQRAGNRPPNPFWAWRPWALRSKIIIGSTNLTQSGLSANCEWNYHPRLEINALFSGRQTAFERGASEFGKYWLYESTDLLHIFQAGLSIWPLGKIPI